MVHIWVEEWSTIIRIFFFFNNEINGHCDINVPILIFAATNV